TVWAFRLPTLYTHSVQSPPSKSIGRTGSSKIRGGGLRQGPRRLTHEGIGIFGADRLGQGAFLGSRQEGERRAVSLGLGYCLLDAPVALDRVPRCCEGPWVFDANVHFQDLAAIDQAPALDHVKLCRMRGFESVHKRLVIQSNGVNDQRIAFV